MIGLIQRVSQASVTVDDVIIGQINTGLLALVGIEKTDDASHVDRLLDKMLDYRVFGDAKGRMNLSLKQVTGGLLLVPQFTLVADTRHGLRPGFSTGASPGDAEVLFDTLMQSAAQKYDFVAGGQFGADMQVALVNDGPVTFWLQT